MVIRFGRRVPTKFLYRLTEIQTNILSIRSKEDIKQRFADQFIDWVDQKSSSPMNQSPVDFVVDAIICNELAPTYEPGKYGVGFSAGRFKVSTVRRDVINRCLNSKSQLYDSNKFQIQVPIYYFQGDRDVNTSAQSARYHHDNQTASPLKVFNLFRGRGHSLFSMGLAMCAANVYSQVFSLSRDLSGVVDSSGNCK